MKNTKISSITDDGAMRLCDILREGNMKKTKRTKFNVNTNDKTGFISLECKACSETFGIKLPFLEKYTEVNYVYRCPYCSNEGKVVE